MDCSGPEYLKHIIITIGNADFYDEVVGIVNNNETKTDNIGSTSMYPRLIMQVHYYNTTTTSWQFKTTVVNETHYLSSGGFLNLRVTWENNGAWNTNGLINGTYRVYLELQDLNGSILFNQNISSMNKTFEFKIINDEILPTYYNVSQSNKVIYRGHNISYTALWRDNFALDKAVLSTNITGNYTNSTLHSQVNLTGVEDISDFNFTMPFNTPPGYLGWRIIGNDSYGNINITQINYSEVWLWMKLNQSKLIPNDTYTGQNINMYCQVVDANYSLPVPGINVSVYGELGYIDSSLTNSSGWAKVSFTDIIAIPEYENITCQISSKKFYNKTDPYNLTEVLHTVSAAVNLLTWDDSDSAPVFDHEMINFFANYTNQFDVAPINGSCNITIFGITHNMTNDVGSLNITWYYNRSFDIPSTPPVNPGLYNWTVRCDAPNFNSIEDFDNVTVQDGSPPNITLMTPANDTNVPVDLINFTFNVTDYSGIENCSLIWHNRSNETRLMTIDTVTNNATNWINYSVFWLGEFNWSIRCVDNSSWNNSGNSSLYTAKIIGPILNMTWNTIPIKVFVRDRNQTFILNLTNLGNNNATNVTINFTIPLDWHFEPGYNNYITFDNLTINQSILITWKIRINDTASFGYKWINVTANSSENLPKNISSAVKVGAKDVGVFNVSWPINNTCSYNNSFKVVSTISNYGDNTSNITVYLKINGTIKDSVNISAMNISQNITVNLTWYPEAEGYYNVTVESVMTSDTDYTNNKFSIFIWKYYVNIKSRMNITFIGDDYYNISFYTENLKSCNLSNVSIYSFIPVQFALIKNSTGPLNNLSVSGPYNGQVYEWNSPIESYGSYSFYYEIDAIDNVYFTSDLYMFAPSGRTRD